MARSILAFMLVAALFLSSTMAQSPASSPRKALSPSPDAMSPSAESPEASPATGSSPPSISESPDAAPAFSPSSIADTPSEAPAPNGAVLNRVTVTGSAAVVIFAAALLM